MVVWSRVVVVKVVRSGWLLNIFKIRVKCFVAEISVGIKRK